MMEDKYKLADLFQQYDIGKMERIELVKVIFAARDKEWVEWIKGVQCYCVVTNDYGQCSFYPECKANLFSDSCSVWQERKRSISKPKEGDAK